MKKIAFLTLTFLALAGCQGLTSSSKPVLLYNLHYTGVAVASAEASGVLAIGEPMLPAGMETDRIALYLDEGRRVDYFAEAAWADSLEDVLQEVIVRAGRAALPNMVIDSPRLQVPANYRLAIKVLDFAPIYGAGAEALPDLKVAVNFTLVHLPEKRVVADFTLENSQPAAANTLPAIAGGMESLLNSILTAAFDKVAVAVRAVEAE